MDDTPHEPVGSLAEEATKLFGAVSEWAREHAPGPDAEGPADPDTAEGVAGAPGLSGLLHQATAAFREINEHLSNRLATGLNAEGAECAYCPLCRTVHAVRTASPEVRAHLSQAASSFLLAAADVLTPNDADRSGGQTGQTGQTGHTGQTGQTGHTGQTGPQAGQRAGARSRRVEHIDLDGAEADPENDPKVTES